MDLHNMDEFLDLQDQNTTNLLSTEQIKQPENVEEEWHSATPIEEILSSNSDKDNWNILQNGLDSLQGINFSEIIQNTFSQDNENCITPDFLIKQPTTLVEDDKRVTRSRTAVKNVIKEEPKKKKNTRAKKVYCICQQPYNGKPMVQCDRCEEWFHCTCVGFNPGTEDEEEVDFICDNCSAVNGIKKQETSQEEQIKQETLQEEPSNEKDPSEEKSTRQTRGTLRSQSTCLYKDCNNHTKADSFCSDVCARKHNETMETDEAVATRRASTRISSMTPKQSSPPQKHSKRKSIEEDDEEQEESDSAESPSQMTEEENPVRRNVIKNMTAILKPIFDAALEKTPDMFEDSHSTSQERAEQLSKSIESTMIKELGGNSGEAYKSKFRSLLYNLKDKANDVFQLRVVTGDLTPMELVNMSSEDMANPELKSMAEVLRKKSLKESVLKLENTPIIKKTHKGDIIMIPDKNNDNMYSEQVQQELNKINQQHAPEVPKKEISSLSPTLASSKDPLDDILARISLPAIEESSGSNKRSNSLTEEDPQAKKQRLALDMEKLLGEEDDTPFVVDEVDTTDLKDTDDEKEEQDKEVVEEEKLVEEKESLPPIWEGHVNMPQVAEFDAIARQIGGRILSPSEWEDVFSPTMWIEGRIPTDRVNNYVTQTQYSQSREIILIEVEAKGGDADEQSQVLLEYFEKRQRYAVVGHNKTRIKDFYLVPLYKSQNIPDCLYVVRVEETKRRNDMFLGVLVLSKQKQVPQQEVYYQPPAQPAVPEPPVAQPAVTEPVVAQPVTYQPYTTTPYQAPQIYQQPSSAHQYSQQYQYGQQSYEGGYNNYQQPQQRRQSNHSYQNQRYQQRNNYNRYYN